MNPISTIRPVPPGTPARARATSCVGGRRQVLAFAAAATLAGCASKQDPSWPPPPPPSATGGTSAGGTVAAPAPSGATTGPVAGPRTPAAILGPERKYLAERFAGTPVTIDFDPEGALIIDVPMAHAFDAGRDQPRPALLKVLDYVSTSLRRVTATRFMVTAAGDVKKPVVGLADRRAAAVGKYIVTRGVNSLRLAATSADDAVGVRVRIVADRPAP